MTNATTNAAAGFITDPAKAAAATAAIKGAAAPAKKAAGKKAGAKAAGKKGAAAGGKATAAKAAPATRAIVTEVGGKKYKLQNSLSVKVFKGAKAIKVSRPLNPTAYFNAAWFEKRGITVKVVKSLTL